MMRHIDTFPGKAPVIFLDIDGVLATDKQFFMKKVNYHSRNPEAAELGAPYPFDPGCVEKLNRILRETGARIVLSSDWRLHWGLEDMRRIFTMNGVEQGPDDVTDDLQMAEITMSRAAEIGTYIEGKGVDHYVVVDDLNVGHYMARTGDEDKFFMTRSSEGLKQLGVADKIIQRLKVVS